VFVKNAKIKSNSAEERAYGFIIEEIAFWFAINYSA
jgi:hypothetical protein